MTVNKNDLRIQQAVRSVSLTEVQRQQILQNISQTKRQTVKLKPAALFAAAVFTAVCMYILPSEQELSGNEQVQVPSETVQNEIVWNPLIENAGADSFIIHSETMDTFGEVPSELSVSWSFPPYTSVSHQSDSRADMIVIRNDNAVLSVIYSAADLYEYNRTEDTAVSLIDGIPVILYRTDQINQYMACFRDETRWYVIRIQGYREEDLFRLIRSILQS